MPTDENAYNTGYVEHKKGWVTHEKKKLVPEYFVCADGYGNYLRHRRRDWVAVAAAIISGLYPCECEHQRDASAAVHDLYPIYVDLGGGFQALP